MALLPMAFSSAMRPKLPTLPCKGTGRGIHVKWMKGIMDCHRPDQNFVLLSDDLVGSKGDGKFVVGSAKTGLVFEIPGADGGKLSNLPIFSERPPDDKDRQSKAITALRYTMNKLGLRRDRSKNEPSHHPLKRAWSTGDLSADEPSKRHLKSADEKRIAVLSQNGKVLTYCPIDFGAHPGEHRGDILYLHTFPEKGNPENRTLCILGGPVPDMTPDDAINRVYVTGQLRDDARGEPVMIGWLGQTVEAKQISFKSSQRPDLLSLYNAKWNAGDQQQNVQKFFNILANEGVKAIAMDFDDTAAKGESILPDAAAVMEASAGRKMSFYITSLHRTWPKAPGPPQDRPEPVYRDFDLQNPRSEQLGGSSAVVTFLWPTGPDVDDFKKALGQLTKGDVKVLSSAASDMKKMGAVPVERMTKADLFYRMMALENLAPHEIAIIDDDLAPDFIFRGFRVAPVPKTGFAFTGLCAETVEQLKLTRRISLK